MTVENKTDTRDPICLTVAESADEVRLSVDSIQKAIKANELAVKYFGSKPLVPFKELRRWFYNLPDAKPKPGK